MTEQPQPVKRPNFFARHKILTGVLAVVAFLVVVSAIAGGGGDDDTAAVAPSTGASAPAEQPAEEPAGEEPAPAEEPEPAEPRIGEPVDLDDFRFTVGGLQEIGTSVGNEYVGQEAQGRYVAVAVTVENIGDSAATFFPSNVELEDAESRTYAADTTAAVYRDSGSGDAFLTEINPGNVLQGEIVFDLPEGVTPTAVVATGGLFSGEVRILLG